MISQTAIDVLKQEADSILKLADTIDQDFETLAEDICNTRGRVIISGIGKSGLIGRKIAATLSSTGTNAMFLHPVEAVHGDLGMVGTDDVFIAISNSGETSELNQLLPVIREVGCRMAAFTGNRNSTMAGYCDLVIYTGVEKEACPFNMAPTCSTTAQLAMGDALAVVLIHKKNFQKSDFMRSHPGGALGKRLNCQIKEVMFNLDKTPYISMGDTMANAIAVMDRHRLGAVMVVNADDQLTGIITDGDIRHWVADGGSDPTASGVESIMTRTPHSLNSDVYLYEALNIMEKHQITVLPIVGKGGLLEGILHLHDILGKGEFKFNGGH